MDNLLVSIITVSLNSEKYIGKTIESVLMQTYKNIEYIIMDGGSSDATLDIIKEYQNKFDGRLHWFSEKDNGIYDAMNKGIKIAKGSVLGIINSDDWYEEDAVSKAVYEFNKEPDIDITHGKLNIVDKDGNYKEEMTLLEDPYQHTFDKFMPVCHPSVFVKKEVYREAGLFDLQFAIAADYDFILRCMKKGFKFKYIASVIANYRQGGISNVNLKRSLMDATGVNIKNGCPRFRAYFICYRSLLKNKLMQMKFIRTAWIKLKSNKVT